MIKQINLKQLNSKELNNYIKLLEEQLEKAKWENQSRFGFPPITKCDHCGIEFNQILGKPEVWCTKCRIREIPLKDYNQS